MQSVQTIEPYHIDTNLPVEGYCESRIGGRNENQDSYGYQDTSFGLLVIVCDGMGGGPAGKTASSIAVNEILAGVMESAKENTPMDVLQLAIKRANQAILDAVEDKPELKGMGTTCTALLINKESAIVAHVGDSRVYQLRGHHKVFRTFDHSVVFEMVKKKVITEEQARLSDQSNIITRALGIKKELEIDIEELPYRKGDRFMLCSDGIHGTMPEAELIKRAMSRGRLDKVVDDLAQYVDDQGRWQGGGHDNLTVALVETKTGSLLKEKNQFKTTIALAIIAAVLAITALLLNSCKNKDIEVATFKIESERVSPSTDTVGMVGTYDFPAEARSMAVNIGLEEDLSDATSHRVAVMGKDYSVTVRGLLPATTYYYCYSADFGLKSELLTETRSFTTSEHVGYRIKVLSDPAWGGTVNGGGDYEEGQTCTVSATPAEGYVFSFWKESEIPLTQEPSYTFEVTESRILVARFAEIAALPVVITGEVTDITGATALGHGEVVGEGDSEVTERGVCWALHHMPTTSDSHAGNGDGTGAYTAEMTGLLLDTTYYVRAYAINSEGTAYGEEKSFVSQLADYTISVSANPSNGGTVSGGGTFQHGQSCTVHANANTGYAFVNWTENGNQVSANANYTFTVNSNRSLVANFTAGSYVISVAAVPEAGGTITGAGGYEYGQSCTLRAVANTGYSFEKWTENGSQVSNNATYTFNVTGSRSLKAHFSAQTYTIAVSANPAIGGVAIGGGTFEYGQSCSLRATANSNYTFANWTENGNVVSSNANYTFTVNANRTLVANFTANAQNYNIAVTASPSNGGFVSGGGTYQQGQSCTVHAEANDGFVFSRWTENGNQVSSNANYTFTVNGNRTLVAHFSQQAPQTYTITVSANPTNGGIVSGGGTYQHGQSCTVTAEANRSDYFYVDFEDGLPSGWTTIDGGNPHGYGWQLISSKIGSGYGHNGSSDGMLSQSYENNYGVVYPDNYLVSPQVTLASGSTFSFYACAHDANYAAEHFGVFVSDNGTSNWTPVQEWTMTAKRNGIKCYGRDGINRAQGNWYNYNVDLSAYAGQKYVAIRHFNCSDMFYLDVDDIELTGSNGYSFVNWTENGNVVSTNASYTFTVNSNRNLVANFTQQSPQNYTISVSANPSNAGTVMGGGIYQQGQTCTVHAAANSGYTFSNWTENGNVVSSNTSYSFIVTVNRTLVAHFTQNSGGNPPTGAINGLFTINSSGDKVWFSRGNLQYRASTNTWRFAENQWEFIGEANANISSSYNGWIDLFGWGTSGYDHGAVCYQPWSTSNNPDDYYAYGQYTYSLYDQTGQADWGYNAISNGGNITNKWRTLTENEWTYVFLTRSTSSGIRYAKARVNNVNGVVLLPDDWESSYYALNNTNAVVGSYNDNMITINEWHNNLEVNGAIFIPAEGVRVSVEVGHCGIIGNYWSSYRGQSALGFNDEFVSLEGIYSDENRSIGIGVRLVQDYR